MGDVYQASARVDGIYRERAECLFADEFEKRNGEIQDWDSFVKEHNDEIYDLQCELMMEAGLE